MTIRGNKYEEIIKSNRRRLVKDMEDELENKLINFFFENNYLFLNVDFWNNLKYVDTCKF